MIDLFQTIIDKIKEKHIFYFLDECITYIISFDLLMFHVGYGTFAMVLNFINNFHGTCTCHYGNF